MKKGLIYSIKQGRLRSTLAWRVVAAGLCSASVMVGCASDKGQAAEEKNVSVESGNLQLALTGVSPSGSVYRLRNALFTIRSVNGNYETFASTEEDPESTFLYLELPSGEYSVYLHPGYTVEQLSAGGGSGPSPTSTSYPPPAPTTSAPTTIDSPITEVGAVSGDEDARGWRERHAAARLRKARSSAPVGAQRSTFDEEPTTEEPVIPVEFDAGAPPAVDGGAPSGELGVQLISPNPAYVYVYGYQVSQVRFSFLVNGAVVNTGNGALVIGADFYEGQTSPACSSDDAYEPNSFFSPASIATDETIYAYACIYDEDMYVFDAPVPAGDFFQIRVEFDGRAGDVDIELGTTDYEYLAGSYGVEDSETVSTVSNGGAYLLHVYNLGPQSVPYTVQFITSSGGGNTCCETSDMPGCSEREVLSCLCAIDAACCQSAFDEICVQEAVAECGAQCVQAEPTSNCCEAAPEPGCTDGDVQACVCGIDPTCCASTFDDNCANLAQGLCGASCEGEE